MNSIQKIKLNIESLLGLTNSEPTFFSSISYYVKKLHESMNNEQIDVDELKFLINKIEEFYKKYRPSDTPGVFYISPKQISNSDSIVKEIYQLIDELSKKTPEEIEEELSKTRKKVEITNSLNIIDRRLLDSCKTAFDSKDYWDFVFKAMRHLEIRIRKKANLNPEDTGIGLITKAFHIMNGKLKIPSCETSSEEEGFFHILRGIVMFHRNAKGHREGNIDKKRALQIVQYIDYLIDMVESSVIR